MEICLTFLYVLYLALSEILEHANLYISEFMQSLRNFIETFDKIFL